MEYTARRFMWWPPTRLTRWWLPSIGLGGDEGHNPSVIVVVPPLGAFIVFYGRRLNRELHPSEFTGTEPTDAPWAEGCPDCAEIREALETFAVRR